MSSANIATGISTGKVTTAIASGEIITTTTTGNITKAVVVTVNSGGEDVSQVIPFTANDLTNGKLVKLHGLNRRVVDVTVTNSSGVKFSPDVDNLADNTREEIDLTRYDIQGTWFLLVQ